MRHVIEALRKVCGDEAVLCEPAQLLAYECDALPHLRARRGGWIVNVSSLSATAPFANGAAYCATKAAVDAFTEALMQEVRHDGIRVASVAPGSVDTSFGGGGRDKRSWALQPDDVAQAIVDLMSHAGRALPSRIEIRPSQPPRKG